MDKARHSAVAARASRRAEAVPQEVADWCETGNGTPFRVDLEMVVVGDGPYTGDKFSAFLRKLGARVRNAGTKKAESMVVGRHDVPAKALDTQLRVRRNSTLKVYSQEMMVAAIITGRDPFGTETDAVLWAFGHGHPVLEHLQDKDFPWPSTEAEHLPDEGPPTQEIHVEESPLVVLGYRAGKTADLSARERRRILGDAYKEDLPWVESDEYMEWWGIPETSKRLWRIAHHMAWLVRTRSGMAYQEYAVEDWVRDLKWLHTTYYRDRMRFRWPGTHVR